MTSPSKILLCTAAVAVLASSPRVAGACTTFAMTRGGATLVGKSYDWKTGHGMLVVNKRGVAKQALVLHRGLRPARWIARHGSVTFNQYGREFPLGGMNEQGLVVEIMWLNATRLGKPDMKRETVNELQLIQYLLDTTANVPQAIAAAGRIQVVKAYALVHYLACDRAGTCASLEYLKGKLVVHTRKRMPARVLTNSTYADSARALSRHAGFGGKAAVPRGLSSLDRFVRAASLARAGVRSRKGAVAYAFGVLESVRQPGYSKWQIIYEPSRGRVHFRNAGEDKHVTIDGRAQDYTCGTPVKIMDLRGTVTGKKGALLPYAAIHNRQLIGLSLRDLGQPFPPAAVAALAAYPDRATRCDRRNKGGGKGKGKAEAR